MSTLKEKIYNRKFIAPVSGILLGTLGGYLYYHFVGCQSGTCAITSNPYLSMLWGAAVGYLVGDMFTGRKKAKPQDITDEQ